MNRFFFLCVAALISTHLLVAAPSDSIAPKILPYKVVNGDTLKVHIFEPKDMAEGARLPAIIYFFGGGWINGTPLQFYRECRYFASRGMVAMTADYRVKSRHHTTPFESFEDAKDAMRWIRTHAGNLHVDPHKIAAAGASAGGQLAAALGTVGQGTDYCPDLMILYYAVVDNSPSGFGPEEMKQHYRKISPLHNISAHTPPALFLVGTKDPIVSVETARRFKELMNEQGVECELHLFRGAGHPIFYYRKPLTNTYYEVLRITSDFLKRQGFLPESPSGRK